LFNTLLIERLNRVLFQRLRECHLCGKKFQRKQNADIHLLGVHNLTKDDLASLGRWNPKKNSETCPDYMTRKTNQSFRKLREKKLKKSPNASTSQEESSKMSTSDDEDTPKTVAFVVVDEIKEEPVDCD
jgi:hypothetical protein